MISTKNAERFLIVRLSALGDTVHSLTLAAALRIIYPQSFIGWVVEEPAAPFIKDNPLLNWWKILPKGWLKSVACVRDLHHSLREQNFEVAFDIQSLSKSAVVAWLSGAKKRIGFARGWGRELAPLLNNHLVRPTSSHVIDQSLELLTALGLNSAPSPIISFPPCPITEIKLINNYLKENCLEKGFHLFSPFTTNLSKNWPLDRFSSLAVKLKAITGQTSLIVGHGPDRTKALDITQNPATFTLLAPDLSLLGVIELIRRASLVVSCDSFPLHVASSLLTTTVGLFGVSNPDRVGPKGPLARSAYGELKLAHSSRARKKLSQEAISSLSVDKVLALCLEVLAA